MLGKAISTTLGINDLFDKIQVSSISGIRVFYVGQGDAIGLLNEKHEVVLYVDYGGLVDHPDKDNGYTNTSSTLPPWHDQDHIPVVLTHWDKDHYFSAKHVKEMLDSQWIVPDQSIGVQATKFSATLNNAYTWPEASPPLVLSFFTINGDEIRIEKIKERPVKSKSEDRNLTGLSITIIKVGVSTPYKFIQLPGDAPFHKIPEFYALQNDSDYFFIGGTAYHHGSKRHWVKKTSKILGQPNIDAKVIYSYGPSNTYGHPSRTNYQTLNWDAQTEETPSYKNKNGYIDFKF